MGQNNNHIVQENNTRTIKTDHQKYRAERTLTFENVLIGDSTLKYLDPARFDVERKTYIKTMVNSNSKESIDRFLSSVVNESLKHLNLFKQLVLLVLKKCK
jgi:hypothetical protein